MYVNSKSGNKTFVTIRLAEKGICDSSGKYEGKSLPESRAAYNWADYYNLIMKNGSQTKTEQVQILQQVRLK